MSESIHSFVSAINKEDYVMGEGEKHFDLAGLDKAKSLMSKYSNLRDFSKNAPLSDKMVLAHYIRKGKWEDTPVNLAKVDDKTARNWGDVILRDYVGLGTRGLIRVDLGIGANIDLFAVEKRLDNNFRNYLDKSTVGGLQFKTGKVFQRMQEFWSKSVKSKVSPPQSLRSIEDSRSELSKSSDERQEHSLVVEPDDPRVERWIRDPGTMDVRGIDTPAKQRVGSKKAKAKSKRRADSPTSVRGIRR